MLTDMLVTNTERFKLLQREFRDTARNFQRASTFDMRQAVLRRLQPMKRAVLERNHPEW